MVWHPVTGVAEDPFAWSPAADGTGPRTFQAYLRERTLPVGMSAPGKDVTKWKQLDGEQIKWFKEWGTRCFGRRNPVTKSRYLVRDVYAQLGKIASHERVENWWKSIVVPDPPPALLAHRPTKPEYTLRRYIADMEARGQLPLGISLVRDDRGDHTVGTRRWTRLWAARRRSETNLVSGQPYNARSVAEHSGMVIASGVRRWWREDDRLRVSGSGPRCPVLLRAVIRYRPSPCGHPQRNNHTMPLRLCLVLRRGKRSSPLYGVWLPSLTMTTRVPIRIRTGRLMKPGLLPGLVGPTKIRLSRAHGICPGRTSCTVLRMGSPHLWRCGA